MADWDTPEDLFKNADEFSKKAKEQFQKFSKNSAGGILVIMVLAILAWVVGSGVYSVAPDAVGVVRRFGKWTRTTHPGLNFKLPHPIETVKHVKVSLIRKEEFGFRTLRSGVVTQYSGKKYNEESLMLTGDLNVLDLEWVVRYKVKDPKKYIFNVRRPRRTVRNISEAVMRQVIGDHSVNLAISTRGTDITSEVKLKMQEIMDSYDSGIHVDEVFLQLVTPPDQVKPSFKEVNAAKQEKEKMLNQAWEAYNTAIPKAKGEAERTIRKSEGYALQRVNQAKGDAAKFIATYEAYKHSKEVTRKRLYLETMNEILPNIGRKYIFDSEQKGILPLLDLSREGGLR